MTWFKKEVLRRLDEIEEKIAKIEAYRKRYGTTVALYRELFDRQEKHIQELQDRLAARTYPELKTFKVHSIPDHIEQLELRPEDDEGLAGEIYEG